MIETIKAYFKKYLLVTVLKLTGFRAWISGLIFNKLFSYVETWFKKLNQKLKDNKLEQDLQKEISKPKEEQDEQKIIEAGKNVLEGK